jgi:hypothetical protein
MSGFCSLNKYVDNRYRENKNRGLPERHSNRIVISNHVMNCFNIWFIDIELRRVNVRRP